MADFMFAESEYEFSSTSLQSLSVMLNAMYVCDTGDFWRPYIGGGVGGVEVNYERRLPTPLPAPPAGSGSEWAFGYQAMAGIAFAVDETHAITLGYRYQAADEVAIGGADIGYASHNISIGVVFN